MSLEFMEKFNILLCESSDADIVWERICNYIIDVNFTLEEIHETKEWLIGIAEEYSLRRKLPVHWIWKLCREYNANIFNFFDIFESFEVEPVNNQDILGVQLINALSQVKEVNNITHYDLANMDLDTNDLEVVKELILKSKYLRLSGMNIYNCNIFSSFEFLEYISFDAINFVNGVEFSNNIKNIEFNSCSGCLSGGKNLNLLQLSIISCYFDCISTKNFILSISSIKSVVMYGMTTCSVYQTQDIFSKLLYAAENIKFFSYDLNKIPKIRNNTFNVINTLDIEYCNIDDDTSSELISIVKNFKLKD